MSSASVLSYSSVMAATRGVDPEAGGAVTASDMSSVAMHADGQGGLSRVLLVIAAVGGLC